MAARAELRVQFKSNLLVREVRRSAARQLKWPQTPLDRYAGLKYPDQDMKALQMDFLNSLIWAGMSPQKAEVSITVADEFVVAIVEHDLTEVVLHDAQYLLKELAFGVLRQGKVCYAELLVESNNMKVLRLDGSARAFLPLFYRHLVTTGVAATAANILIRLADQLWSWNAVWLGLGAAILISLIFALVEQGTIEEVTLRGIK